MERAEIRGLSRPVSRIGLGTWWIGGPGWSAADDAAAVATVHAALDRGVTLVDTSPEYGRGRAEELVGRALATWRGRERPALATKLALGRARQPDPAARGATTARVRAEVEGSLRRLGVESIDLCMVTRLEDATPIDELAEALARVVREGKVGAVGACGPSVARTEALRARLPLAAVSAPYDLLERGIEEPLLPWCRAHAIPLVAYGALCRGLLSGHLSPAATFDADELRRADPKFRAPRYHACLAAAAELDAFARAALGKTVLELAVRWVLDQPGVSAALWSARRPSQLDPIPGVLGWTLDPEALARIDEIVRAHLGAPRPETPATSRSWRGGAPSAPVSLALGVVAPPLAR